MYYVRFGRLGIIQAGILAPIRGGGGSGWWPDLH